MTLTAPRSVSRPWRGRSFAPISPANGFTYRTALRTELGPARLLERTTRQVGCPVVRWVAGWVSDQRIALALVSSRATAAGVRCMAPSRSSSHLLLTSDLTVR